MQCAQKKNTELHTNEDLPTFAGKSAVGAARNLQYRALRRRAGQCAVLPRDIMPHILVAGSHPNLPQSRGQAVDLLEKSTQETQEFAVRGQSTCPVSRLSKLNIP